LNILGKKHDLIGIVLEDPREKDLPKAGLIKFRDAETNEIRFVDSSSKAVRDWFFRNLKTRNENRRSLFLSGRIDSIKVDVSQSYIKPLVDFFKLRERRW